ncbi:MAG: hypothetical protein ACRYFV_20475 [Janthinobacterium lividum]
MKIHIIVSMIFSALLLRCEAPKKDIFVLQPKVLYGFVIYDNFAYTQMSFVPIENANHLSITLDDFKTQKLGKGFTFSPTCVIREELSLIKKLEIKGNIVTKNKHTVSGAINIFPARVVCENDPNSLYVFNGKKGLDTIYYNNILYNHNSNSIRFVVDIGHMDVLKVSSIEKF